jgi:hypothetical protein
MPKKKPPKKKPPKKKVKKQPKSKRRFQPDVQPAPGVLSEGMPAGQQPTKPSVSPKEVGHWGHPDRE